MSFSVGEGATSEELSFADGTLVVGDALASVVGFVGFVCAMLHVADETLVSFADLVNGTDGEFGTQSTDVVELGGAPVSPANEDARAQSKNGDDASADGAAIHGDSDARVK